MERLTRFTDVVLTDPTTFGGGAAQARIRSRVATVAYGYHGVLEEFEEPDNGTVWCMLSVTLPGLAPRVSIDHRTVFGRPGVPAAGHRIEAIDDLVFDKEYVVVAEDETDVKCALTPPVRELLVEQPVQRLELADGLLLLRTFDGMHATPDTIGWLDDLVEDLLSCTPSFVTPRSGHGLINPKLPLVRGVHALNDPDDRDPPEPRSSRLGGLLAGLSRSRG